MSNENEQRDRVIDRLLELGEDHFLDAPCIWCEYDGAGYWQSGTHAPHCPWHTIGGQRERAMRRDTAIRAALQSQQ